MPPSILTRGLSVADEASFVVGGRPVQRPATPGSGMSESLDAATPSRPDSPLLLGVDLGKVTTSLALGELEADGGVRVLGAWSERHQGDPLQPFLEAYRGLDHRRIVGIAATGIHGDRLGAPVLAGVPEEIAQEAAAAWLYPDGPLNVLRIGAGGYSVFTRDAQGRVAYEANKRCSAGTGETVEGLCSRLGWTLDEAIELAQASADGVTVTSRCAVFAKSELTHFANQGEPHGRIFRGLFVGVAGNVYSLYDRNRVEGPLLLIGHGALIGPIAERVALLSGRSCEVAARAGVFEALGVLRHAGRETTGEPFPEDPEELVRATRARIGRLRPAHEGPGSVVRLEEPEAGRPGPAGATILGLDLGSTGSKAAVLDAASGAVLACVYRRTEGNPVEAAQALVAEVREMALGPVVAVGLTGSGRDAAATVCRAAYPNLGARLVVQNEIVAHATAAVRLDPDGGESLSIVEIGGQDAKFINVRGGRVVDADMNRVCSAGTGSFLEEQATAHGIADMGEFGRLAAQSDAPPDLGQTCTVFVADVAAEALSDGYSRADIFAGLQHSVVRNYRSRVMGQRQLLRRVFFQGKPATDPGLARTLAAVLEREVYVPADPGAMGAVGIALMTLPEVSGPAGAAPIDLERVLEARVTGRRDFQCKDRDCRNRCRLEVAEIEVAGEREKVVSGGQCPKYDDVAAVGAKLPKDAPAPYRERRELIAALLAEEEGDAAGPRLGLPYVHYLIDTLPFFHTFLHRMGYAVDVLRPGPDTLAEGDRRCTAPGACAPVKLLHGLAGADVTVLVAPVFVHLPLPNAGAVTYTCPMTQGAPDMVARALAGEASATRVFRPILFEREGDGFEAPRFRRELEHAAIALATGSDGATAPGFSRPVFRAAHAAALASQRRYEAGLRAIGVRALAWAREHGYPVVLIAGETHVVHEPMLDAGIHELVAANGALALPVDCYPVPSEVPRLRRVHWAGAGPTLRAAAAGAEAGDVFPLLLGAFGCGPNSMIEHLFADTVADWPHAVLESDGHGGKAGYVTRVQAFLHSVHGWQGSEHVRPGAGDRLARYDRSLPRSLERGGYDRYYFGHVGGGLGRHLAAGMRGAGFDAHYVGTPDAAALRAAGASCSGKECLPYQLIWGAFERFISEEVTQLGDRRALLLSAGHGFQACRANLFPLTQQLALEQRGLGGRVDVADYSIVSKNPRMMSVAWAALVAVDLLNMMRFYNLVAELEPGGTDQIFEEYSGRLEALLERPRPQAGFAGPVAAALRVVPEVEALVAEAARAFRRQPLDPQRLADAREVYLCGDLFLRVDEWGNDDLQRKLAVQGLRVILEPYGEFFELLALRAIQERESPREVLSKRGTLLAMHVMVGRLVGVVRAEHPWVFWHDVRDIDRESRRLTSGYPFGETIPTVGGALLSWRTQPIDGVVAVAPRGCGPALIAEAQLRRESGLPVLFVYNDGDPIDEGRLAGFAWRLRRHPARRAVRLPV